METKEQLNKIKNILNFCDHCMNMVVWIIVLLVILSFGWFSYNKFYQTYIQIGLVSQLKSQVTDETLDIQRWQKIKENYEWKKQTVNPDKLARDPFQ